MFYENDFYKYQLLLFNVAIMNSCPSKIPYTRVSSSRIERRATYFENMHISPTLEITNSLNMKAIVLVSPGLIYTFIIFNE